MVKKRRYTDHLKQASDHDLLIRLNAKVSILCTAHADTNNSLKAYMEKIDQRCEHRTDICSASFESKLNANTFWKIFGVIVFVFVILSGAVSFNSITSAKNSSIVSTHLHK